MKMHNQKGFGGVEGLLILVIIGLIGGTGYFVLHSQQQTQATLNSTSKAAGNVQKTAAKPSQIQTSSSKKFLEIPEMGIKLSLTKDIEDAYYKITDDNGQKEARLGVHLLDSVQGCNLEKSNFQLAYLANIPKDRDGGNIFNGKYTDQYKGLIVGDRFYYIALAQISCSTDKDNLSVQEQKARDAFQNASATLQKL